MTVCTNHTYKECFPFIYNADIHIRLFDANFACLLQSFKVGTYLISLTCNCIQRSKIILRPLWILTYWMQFSKLKTAPLLEGFSQLMSSFKEVMRHAILRAYTRQILTSSPKLSYWFQGAFLVFNHLNRLGSLIDYWIWCSFALIAYFDYFDSIA